MVAVVEQVTTPYLGYDETGGTMELYKSKNLVYGAWDGTYTMFVRVGATKVYEDVHVPAKAVARIEARFNRLAKEV